MIESFRLAAELDPPAALVKQPAFVIIVVNQFSDILVDLIPVVSAGIFRAVALTDTRAFTLYLVVIGKPHFVGRIVLGDQLRHNALREGRKRPMSNLLHPIGDDRQHLFWG